MSTRSIDRSMDGWNQSINQSIKMIASMIGYLRWIFERHGHFRPYDGHTPVWIGRSCLIGCEVKGLRSVPHFRYVPKKDTMWYFTPADPLVSGSGRGEANTIYVWILINQHIKKKLVDISSMRFLWWMKVYHPNSLLPHAGPLSDGIRLIHRYFDALR